MHAVPRMRLRSSLSVVQHLFCRLVSFFFKAESVQNSAAIPVCQNTTGLPRSIRSTCELDTGTGWESIPLRSSLSRVSLSLNTVVVGEVDELEEDVG